MLKKISEGIRYQKLTEEEKKARGILGRLVGVCADFNKATRNGRKYSEQLWENVFNNPIMQEKIKNKVCYGELGHPEDRAEIDPEKIAVCLSEQPVKNKNGQLEAVFDILDTPNGRILKTLCDYGSILGVSSRGQGDIITDYDGQEAVDPDTYECECWDIVLIPAVESARMDYVREGLDTKKLKLRKALTEAFNKESEEGKKVMAETLKELNIKLDEAKKGAKKDAKKADKAKDAEPEETEVAEVETDSETEDRALFNPDDQVEVDPEVTEPEEGEVEFDDSELAMSDAEVAKINEPFENPDVDAEPEEDTRTDEEIFLDYLVNNFDEKQIKKACKALDIEIPEEEEKPEGEEEADEEEVEETETEDEAEDKEDTEEDKNSTDEESDEDKDSDEDDESDEEDEDDDEDEEALDKGSEDLIQNLQEALKSKVDLEKLVKTLKEKLAVSDAKVIELTEECDRFRSSITRLASLAKSSKDLQNNVNELQESLKVKDQTIEDQKTRIMRLVESKKESVRTSSTLNESINAKNDELRALNESVENLKTKYENKFKELREQVIKESAAAEKKATQLNESLSKATALKESYKKLANQAMNMLIEERATQLGLTSQDIKRKLGASYTISDVNTVCEELKRYQLNISKLPFSVDRKVNVRVNEGVSKAAVNRAASSQCEDDDVDDSLIRLANLR